MACTTSTQSSPANTSSDLAARPDSERYGRPLTSSDTQRLLAQHGISSAAASAGSAQSNSVTAIEPCWAVGCLSPWPKLLSDVTALPVRADCCTSFRPR
jgi:hypothetical protein